MLHSSCRQESQLGCMFIFSHGEIWSALEPKAKPHEPEVQVLRMPKCKTCMVMAGFQEMPGSDFHDGQQNDAVHQSSPEQSSGLD